MHFRECFFSYFATPCSLEMVFSTFFCDATFQHSDCLLDLMRKIWKKSPKMRLGILLGFFFLNPEWYIFPWLAKNEEKLPQITYKYISLSADKWKIISVFYRYRPIRKLDLSVLISIVADMKKSLSIVHYHFGISGILSCK